MSSNGTNAPHLCNLLPLVLYYILPILLLRTAHLCHGCYTHMFIFGDSLTDTGNYFSILGNSKPQLPYGMTYFHKATGRWSDGRVFADFVADELGVPLPAAYLQGKTAEDFLYGANFAVGGATALNHSFFLERGITLPDQRVGFLALQINWFKQLMTVLCPHSDCRKILESSFFLVGEIGVNDYSILASLKVPFNEIRTYVPHVTGAIGEGIKELIELGAKTLVVPGIIPFGCTPFYHTMFQTENSEDYDEDIGCMKWLNEFSEYHEQLLNKELNQLQQQYPEATIIYADYNGASIDIFKSAEQYGFENPLFACCGGEGRYNFTFKISCGDEGYRVCADPSRYVSWDGLHLTDRANELIVQGAFKKIDTRLDICKYSSDLDSVADLHSVNFEL